MVYQGSKNRISKFLVPIIQKYIDDNNIKTYIEPMCGSCSIIEKIKCENKIAADVNDELIALLRYVKSDPFLSIAPHDCNFEHYSDTRARGKLTSIGEIKGSYLKQYLYQLFNCTHIAEVLKDKYPQVGAEIEHQEQTYFISYYDELARDVNLPAGYSDKVKNYYLRTKNKALQQIAMKL